MSTLRTGWENTVHNARIDRGMARTAGIALAAITVLAIFANFLAMQNVISETGTDRQFGQIRSLDLELRLAAVAFVVIAALDIVVGWSLARITRKVSDEVLLLASVFRYVYAAVLIVVAVFIVMAVVIATGPLPGASEDANAAVFGIQAADQLFMIGLSLFGCHLVTLGIGLLRWERMPRWISWLVIIAGVGYLLDTLVGILNPDATFEFAAFAFVGEAILMFWLLWRGFRLDKTAPPDAEADSDAPLITIYGAGMSKRIGGI